MNACADCYDGVIIAAAQIMDYNSMVFNQVWIA